MTLMSCLLSNRLFMSILIKSFVLIWKNYGNMIYKVYFSHHMSCDWISIMDIFIWSGKPYAYTPFCTSRQETLGFQFWGQGYWKDHLRGKPYHISALYVVDLQKFRRNAVGDQLRSIYDGWVIWVIVIPIIMKIIWCLI